MKYLKRCPARLGDSECGSAVFYDWGLIVLNVKPAASFAGGTIAKFDNYAQSDGVKICGRCTTPYVIEAGELIDISAELGAEDVKAILTRGQATLPHPKIKDP